MAQDVQAASRGLGLPVLCGRCPNRRIVTRVGADDGVIWVAYSSPHARWRVHARRGGGGMVWGWSPETGGRDGMYVNGDGIAWAPLDPGSQTPTEPITLTMAGCRRHPRAVRLDRLWQAVADAERAGRSELVTFVDL
jgi:hypothetical protein